MRHRLAARLLRERLRQSPAVAPLGPRQCGRTTLARSLAARDSMPKRLTEAHGKRKARR